MGNLGLHSAEEPDNLRATTGTVEVPTIRDNDAALALGGRPIHTSRASGTSQFSGDFTPKWGAMATKPPKGTSLGRNGFSGLLIMSLSVIVPEKSRGNKKCDKEEERHIFDLFLIAVKWS